MNDARLAENLAGRLQERGGSRRAIIEKLRRRGVTSGVAFWAIGLLVGINLVMMGIAIIFTAQSCKKMAQTKEGGAPHQAKPA